MARGVFWTIIVDDQPTAFRAPVREDLLPTLTQLQRQHPTAVIKWFQRGRLWETPGDAMDASKPPRREVGWRPGGEHKDPRDQYKVPRDVKRARWASQAADGRGPWMKTGTQEGRRPGRQEGGAPGGQDERPPRKPFVPRDGDRLENAERRTPASPKPGGEGGPNAEGRPAFRPRSDRPSGDRPAWKPKADRPAGADRPSGDRPAWKPRSDRPTGDRPAWKPKTDRPSGDRPAWKPKTDRPSGARPAWKPGTDRPAHAERRAPASPKPPGEGGPRSGAPRSDWRGDRADRRDSTPRAGGDAPRPPAAKKGRTWRAGELPPADRKRKKEE